MIQTTDLSPLGSGGLTRGLHVCIHVILESAYTSRYKHITLWIKLQMIPYKAFIKFKAIWFWRTALILRDISGFSPDSFCWLSSKACWVNLIRT